jgi:hypothetical protein
MTARQQAVHARHYRKEALQAGATTCPLGLLPRGHEDLTPYP